MGGTSIIKTRDTNGDEHGRTRPLPSPRLAPLPEDHSPELKENFEFFRKSLGFVPNSMLIMQRKPRLVKAFNQLSQAIWDPQCAVSLGFKRLVGHVASRGRAWELHGISWCSNWGHGLHTVRIYSIQSRGVEQPPTPVFFPGIRSCLGPCSLMCSRHSRDTEDAAESFL